MTQHLIASCTYIQSSFTIIGFLDFLARMVALSVHRSKVIQNESHGTLWPLVNHSSPWEWHAYVCECRTK